MSFTAAARVFIVFGDPVEHSLSPVMQNAALQAAGIDGLYIPWRVKPEGLPIAFESLRRMENFGGANVTLPHKEQAASLVDELSSEAASVGAVNTLVPRGGHLLGATTDGRGFLRSLQEEAGFVPRGRQAVILGAGGAARAVAWSLAEAGVSRLFILNRTVERAESLALLVSRGCGVSAIGLCPSDPRVSEKLADSELLVNATSVGLAASDPPAINPALLHPRILVYDLIYRPRETALLREAKKRGCRVLGGLGMLLYQGALAFELWTGQKASEEAMRRALIETLS
ncbi:MAG: shikimate dehydrogenase [candidate division NC10 bacterium]|nr:shikimate dehydrogenase [candidate division NC10 bacterium]